MALRLPAARNAQSASLIGVSLGALGLLGGGTRNGAGTAERRGGASTERGETIKRSGTNLSVSPVLLFKVR